ncbi:MAG: hypothetical protein HC810_01355 [Acaryochloridaceae cyanobacterium RL_2_7]|nr:hypothetical protein [Acaryochloridaceae cyanobacterium RL_2_7]
MALKRAGGSTDQCLHPQMGLTPCHVSLDETTARLNIVWPDGGSTDLKIGNDTVSFRDQSDAEWQAAQYVGLCYEEQCFQAKAEEINALDRGNEKIAAQCYDPMNGTSACYVQSSADAQILTVSFLNGTQFSLADQGRPSLGVCADNICAFKVQPQAVSQERLAQVEGSRLERDRP